MTKLLQKSKYPAQSLLKRSYDFILLLYPIVISVYDNAISKGYIIHETTTPLLTL